MMIDTAIILAGGLGTRLRPLTDNTPKPMLPIKGKPILQHGIENLKKFGVKKVIISIGYKAEQVKNYFGDGRKWDLEISYADESLPLGTGGAVKKAAFGLKEPFFLAWGDNLMDIDWQAMMEQYSVNKSRVMMSLTPREDVENFGVAKLEGSKILYFVEKPKREEAPSNLINAGAFIIDPKALEILPEGTSSIERDCFEKLAPKGEISAYVHEGQWFPTDTLEKYGLACMNFVPKIDFSKKKVIIADVDDTICESCQLIKEEMVNEISRLVSKGYSFAFISGTGLNSLQRMISSRLKAEHYILATTGTNCTRMIDDNAEIRYNYSLPPEDKEKIFSALDKLINHYQIPTMTTKDDQVQDRDSQITLSAIGRHAPTEEKAKYDPDGKKRLEWIEFLKKELGENLYDLKIGGTTSIDVTKKGMDKEWGIKKFVAQMGFGLNEVLFIGDKLFPGGNDYPAAKIVDCIGVNNPGETIRKLKEL